MEKSINNVIYKINRYANYTKSKPQRNLSIKDITGIDTEADNTGKCFLVCLSDGLAFKPSQFPKILFSHKYRDRHYVSYNLRYEEGALIQKLPVKNLKELWKENKTVYKKYTYKIISGKSFIITYGHHSIWIWDMYNFYHGSLDFNAKKYLNKSKLISPVKEYTDKYILENLESIKTYCVNDALLVKLLADKLICIFRSYEIEPTRLYSTAYISFHHFKRACNYVRVEKIWDTDKKILGYAMKAYAGGKFETTERGAFPLWEYDITSAYPFEIANLISIENSRTVWSNIFRKDAKYALIECKINIPSTVFSPLPVKTSGLNIFPVGEICKTITLQEYNYMRSIGCDIKILSAVWFHLDTIDYPYKKEIARLVKLKAEYKISGDELKYHTVKILLNSLYGKMVQLIETDKGWKAGESWNPIYAGIITANCRIRVSAMQNEHPEIIAVHTDSIISRKELKIPVGLELGDWTFETSGNGLICGSGIYQIGTKTRLRGFDIKQNLFELFDTKKPTVTISSIHARTWRETVFHGWEKSEINHFITSVKTLSVNFDTKRIWLKKYISFRELLTKKSDSIPYFLGCGFE